MPRGLDPNASFRDPVDREALKQPAKILVDCTTLEYLITSVPITPMAKVIVEDLWEQITAARKAQK